jgi:hypothetical protein
VDYEFHSLANLFPLLEGGDFDDLLEDMRANGQRHKITLYQGKILDGRNRYRGCKALGREPEVRDLPDGTDALAFVLSANLRRRHLDASQRALVAARVLQLRQKPGASAPGAPAPSPAPPLPEPAAPRGPFDEPTRSPAPKAPPAGKAAAQVAEAAGVSTRTVEQAQKVQADGIAPLADLVQAGKVSVKAAADVARLPESQQQEVVEDLKRGLRPAEAIARAREQAGDVPRDGLGREVPPALRDVFADRLLADAVRYLEQLIPRIKTAASWARYVRLAEAVQALQAAAAAVAAGVPHAVHPKCGGQGCGDCRGSGHVPAWRHEELLEQECWE